MSKCMNQSLETLLSHLALVRVESVTIHNDATMPVGYAFRTTVRASASSCGKPVSAAP